ncbi:hypothetical protein HK414_25395 [Ramlibacter terrae]|uniref:Permuted papain-like amidase enzyme, YaeF/YiiX, C92 family n=1 Tax=Ramlibacter terrae TaxID=2732511 RepID=A0ABX6P5N7_9BURK|nr:hypothetical protein HK414_25395 [Ramlibacter terrae]
MPYDSSEEVTREVAAAQWQLERDGFVAKVRSDPTSSPELRQLATYLEALSYGEFATRYLSDVDTARIAEYGGLDDIFSVGHVGIIDVVGGVPYVIEAVWGGIKKVQRISYDDWLKARPSSWVWVARPVAMSDKQRSSFVEEARSFVGRPYDFWNFDLSDDSAFYCSKLVWLAYRRAVGHSIDGHAPTRSFWFSPKQLWSLHRSGILQNVNVPRQYSY